MRTVALLVAACLAVVAVGFAIRGCGRASTPVDRISPGEVTSITVSVPVAEMPRGVFDASAVNPFVAAPDDNARLLALVQGGEVDRNPFKWGLLCDLRIRLRDERGIDVTLFRTGDDRGAYRIDGVYYRGTSDEEIMRTVTECAKRGKPPAN